MKGPRLHVQCRLQGFHTCNSSLVVGMLFSVLACTIILFDSLHLFSLVGRHHSCSCTVCRLTAERYVPGVGRGVSNTDALKREIIHRLYIAPQTHSELIKQFRVSGGSWQHVCFVVWGIHNVMNVQLYMCMCFYHVTYFLTRSSRRMKTKLTSSSRKWPCSGTLLTEWCIYVIECTSYDRSVVQCRVVVSNLASRGDVFSPW